MELVVSPIGVVRCVYDDDVDLHALGAVQIRRASTVEPDEAGRWWADLSHVSGPKLGPFARRGGALAAEVRWLEKHRLCRPPTHLHPREIE